MQGEDVKDFTYKTLRMDQGPSTKGCYGERAMSPALASPLLYSSCLDVKEMPRTPTYNH